MCNKCDKTVHKKCCKTKNTLNAIVEFRNQSYSKQCIDIHDILRYNPFYQKNSSDDSDKFYDDEPSQYIDSIHTISNILENYGKYSISELNTKIKTLPKNTFSSFFLNIDGNHTNFDTFAVSMASIKHNFSVIGLAETNTDSCNADLYKLSGYNSCYQDCIDGKRKGSGVGLYIHNTLNFTKNNKLSLTSKHIESLFVSITNSSKPKVVGVIYRPPSGDISEFHKELDKILNNLPADKQASIVMGDFNINLLKSGDSSKDSFEEVIYTSGFAPMISTPTHQQPQSARTCIDNILANFFQPEMVSGVISDPLSHHHPIFHFSTSE